MPAGTAWGITVEVWGVGVICWQAVKDNIPKDTHKGRARRLKIFMVVFRWFGGFDGINFDNK
jgi:hypothetical protein